MNKRAKAGCLLLTLGIFVTLPIKLYLEYQVLSRVGATQLMWFLFFANIPFGLLIAILTKFSEGFFENDKEDT